MDRRRIMIGLLAALLVVAGGIYGMDRVYACGTCPAHAQAKTPGSTDAATQAADAVMPVGDACCAAGQTAQKAGVQTAVPACVTGSDARQTGAGSGCATQAGAKPTAAKSSCTSGARTASAAGECEWKGTLSAEATLARLTQCGIDIDAAGTEELAAKLAEKGCAGYTAEQWAAMINSARGLEAGKSEAIVAGAKGHICTEEACPMALVAKELGARNGEGTQN